MTLADIAAWHTDNTQLNARQSIRLILELYFSLSVCRVFCLRYSGFFRFVEKFMQGRNQQLSCRRQRPLPELNKADFCKQGWWVFHFQCAQFAAGKARGDGMVGDDQDQVFMADDLGQYAEIVALNDHWHLVVQLDAHGVSQHQIGVLG